MKIGFRQMTAALDRHYAIWIVIGLVGAIWLRRAASAGLWLDETVSFYTSQGGTAETIRRAAHYHFQWPFYYLLLSALIQSGFSSEFALRLP